MSDLVQITLIICLTIIICYVISTFWGKEEKPNQIIYEKDISRLDEMFDNKCKSPTYQRPPRPGRKS